MLALWGTILSCSSSASSASSSNPSLQNTPCLCSWVSESLPSLLTVWFLQTIHSKHATEGIAPGDTNIGAWSTLTWSCLVCGHYRLISAQGATRTHSLFLSCSWYSSPLSRAHKASGCTWLRVNICFAKGELKIAVCQRVCWKGLLLCPKHTQGLLFFALLCHPAPSLTVLPYISHKVSVIKNPVPTTFWQPRQEVIKPTQHRREHCLTAMESVALSVPHSVPHIPQKWRRACGSSWNYWGNVLFKDCLNPTNLRIYSQLVLPTCTCTGHTHHPWTALRGCSVSLKLWDVTDYHLLTKRLKVQELAHLKNAPFGTECKWISIGTCHYFMLLADSFAMHCTTFCTFHPLLLASRKADQLEMCLQNCICSLLQGQLFKVWESQP